MIDALFDLQRIWASWLIVSYYATGLALGALCLIAIDDVSGAVWSVVVRRAQEACAGLLPFASIALLAVFLIRPQLYEWTNAGYWASADPALAFKRTWLDWPWFLARAIGCLAVWNIFAWSIRRANVRWSAAFLVVFALTHSIASFDWIMSLEPAWYSSIFAVYNFGGILVTGVAVTIVATHWLERHRSLGGPLTDDHRHDLGKLLFACSIFWMYVWFSQYMLIWYANIPEETAYFVRRTGEGWRALFLLNLFAMGVAPTVVLLRRDAKRSPALLVSAALVVLVGRWIDLYLMIAPGGMARH